MSRGGIQLSLRLPPGMYTRLMKTADKNRRLISAEVIEALQKHLDTPTVLEHFDQRLRRVESLLHLPREEKK